MISEDFDLAKNMKSIYLLELGDRSIDTLFLLSCFHAIEERWESSLELTDKILDARTESFTPAEILEIFHAKKYGEMIKKQSNIKQITISPGLLQRYSRSKND